MRRVVNPQLQFGEQDISAIELDPKSRDDIPQILRGLQYIYVTPEIRERVFAILADVVPMRQGEDGAKGQADAETGRPGMEQWKILVLGALRQGLNADYDRIQELANRHTTIRQMLGHGDWADETRYPLQTLKDNLRLFTPEILDRINQEVVRAGHRLVKKNPDDDLHARVDSFVVETDVHYPTDINLLYDAVRKAIETMAGLCDDAGLSDWRQSAYNMRQFKKAYRHVQRLRHSTSKDADKREARQEEIEAAYEVYLQQAEVYLMRLAQTRITLRGGCALPEAVLAELDDYVDHAERQIDQIRRRVLQGETIAHVEKVFSIFEPHTEWIVKGKAGVPVELGLRVAIVEDQYRFILHHQVMENTTDDKIAVAIVRETRERFPAVRTVSMDKGFHSVANQAALKAMLDRVVLPRKGKLSQVNKAIESDPEFIRLRHQHSAVESAIDALEAHGLDICPDHGIDGFKRYVALAVVARNTQRLGAILQQREVERLREQEKRAA
jgi:IS5 family transposase